MLNLSKQYFEQHIDDFWKEDIEKLQKLIEFHSNLYYNKQEPIIGDYEYDILLEKLQTLEEKYGIENKVWDMIGSDLVESSFEKVAHSRPMISLWNTYNNDDLDDFDERVKKNIWENDSSDIIDYMLEFKFDGLGVELVYKEGKLVQAITRWNGIEGEDVTQNVMQIANIPKTIRYLDHLEVRGEVVMPISSFESLNAQAKIDGGKIFSNPRNAASGSLRMKDNTITKKRNLQFFAYDLANFDEYSDSENLHSYYKVIKAVEGLWFAISSYFLQCRGIGDIKHAIENFGDVKKTIDFEIDGLVLKVDNIDLWETIGWTAHHPRYAIAYKFPAEILTTKILSVEHSVWRTGTITPVANLEPITIGWAVIRRATLHNYEEVENLDVRVGDSVFIKRAWEVIPKIISVVQQDGRDEFEVIHPPKYCPSCESVVKKDEDKVRFYCTNAYDCPAQNSEKLAFAVGKQGFNIDWFWVKQVELFLELWIIHNIVDVFTIAEKKDEILELEWFREKSVDNLIIWVEKAKKIDISTLLTALWIAWVGKKTAKTIAKLVTARNSPLLEWKEELENLIALEDIGPEIAENLIEYFSNQAHQKILSQLLDLLDVEYYHKVEITAGHTLFWKKVCITGSFIWEDGNKISRDILIEKLEAVWGISVSSVTKNTDYLLAGEKAGSKLKKANDLGVEIIDLTIF